MPRKIRTYSKDEWLVEHQRDRIAECSARLFLKKGFEKTRIQEIAEACDMSRGGLYHYIGSKDDILRLIVERMLISMRGLAQDISSNIDKMSATEILQYVTNKISERSDRFFNSVVFLYMETKNLQPVLRRDIALTEVSIIEEIVKVFNKGCASGEFEIDDTKLAAHNFVVLMEMWAIRQWFLKRLYGREEYVEKQTAFIFRAIQKTCEPLIDISI